MNIVNHVLKDITAYRVTSPFGMRNLTIGGKTVTQMHNGIDVVPKADIVAIARGKVIKVIDNVKESQTKEIIAKAQTSLYYGNVVYLQHNNGQVTRYAHLQFGTVKVKLGQIVDKGQVIAHMGTTGYSTGIHLHFEVLENGKRVDPAPYLTGQKQIADFNESIAINRDGVATLTVNTTSLRLRDKPNGTIITTLEHGAILTYLGKTNIISGYEWAEVLWQDKIGYCALQSDWNTISHKVVEVIKTVEIIKEVTRPVDETFEKDGVKVRVVIL
jgi:hypothetical protein